MLAVIVLTAATLMAQSTTSTTTSTAKTRSKAKRTATAKAPAITAADVQMLKEALAAQQQQTQQLQQQMQQQMQQREAEFQQSQQQARQQLQQAQTAAADAEAKATSLESSASQEKTSVDKLSGDLADMKTTIASTAVATQEEQKRFSAWRAWWVVSVWWATSGCVGESFFQSYAGCNATGVAAGKGPVCADRNRARIRVRFGDEGKLNEDFTAGFGLATGSLADTSANETFTNFFARKTIGLDKGYITYNPVAHKWLSLTGGKFVAPWNRTWVTFTPDIN